jgi:LuxR family maltose regulon positive regulatory protein
MTRPEAVAGLRAAGHDLDSDNVELLLHRTEGWPAGLSLAAVLLDERGSAGGLAHFDGADGLVAGYLDDEVLAELGPDRHDLLVRTSILDTLTAPLCDAVMARPGSAAALAELARANLLVPLDRTNERFRAHRLLAGALSAELERSLPALRPCLHRRAAAWHRATGDVDRAVGHLLLSGDAGAAGDLVWESLAALVAEGRVDVLGRRLGHFTPAQIAKHPGLALAAAGRELVLGQGHRVEHWAAAAAVAAPPGQRPAVDAVVTLLRAALDAGDAARMRDAAAHARLAHPHDGAWRSLCCLLQGVAHRLLGERAEAERRLEEGTRCAAVAAPHVHALCLAERAVVALDDGDRETAAALAARARSQVERHGLGRHATTALVFAASALVRAQRGGIDAAQADLHEAAGLQASLTDFAPWYGAEVSVLLARAALRLSDVRLAREHLVRAERRLTRVPGAIALREHVEACWSQLESLSAPGQGPTASMTAAELRILRFLPTHLSFREIAERTYVSANTVKTQANAVYRKLDVSCRSDAVARARARGLIDV